MVIKIKIISIRDVKDRLILDDHISINITITDLLTNVELLKILLSMENKTGFLFNSFDKFLFNGERFDIIIYASYITTTEVEIIRF